MSLTSDLCMGPKNAETYKLYSQGKDADATTKERNATEHHFEVAISGAKPREGIAKTESC